MGLDGAPPVFPAVALVPGTPAWAAPAAQSSVALVRCQVQTTRDRQNRCSFFFAPLCAPSLVDGGCRAVFCFRCFVLAGVCARCAMVPGIWWFVGYAGGQQQSYAGQAGPATGGQPSYAGQAGPATSGQQSYAGQAGPAAGGQQEYADQAGPPMGGQQEGTGQAQPFNDSNQTSEYSGVPLPSLGPSPTSAALRL